MTTEDIKRIVDDERTEQLTAQLCRHWEVATQRLEALVKDLEDGMDTCIEAEVYAAVMRMQSAVMAMMELNKMPCAFLFSEYLDHIAQSVSNTSIRESVMALAKQLFTEQPAMGKRHDSFFELVAKMMAQHSALPKEKQDAIQEKISPKEHVFALFAQYLKPEDLMMVASLIQEINVGDQEEIAGNVMAMRQTMDDLAGKMGESRLHLLICMVLLVLLPGLMVNMFQQSRRDSKAMAGLLRDCRKILRNFITN